MRTMEVLACARRSGKASAMLEAAKRRAQELADAHGTPYGLFAIDGGYLIRRADPGEAPPAYLLEPRP